jgi:YVTN family beta-propeller protein
MGSLLRRARFGPVLLLAFAACGGGGSRTGLDDAGGGESTAVPSSAPVAPITVDAVYVVNGGSHSISVIDAAKGAVIGAIELSNAPFPHHLSLSADRSRMLVAVPGMDFSMGHHGGAPGARGTVMVLDAKTGATIAARRLDAMNHNAVFSPSGAEIWTSQMTMPGKVLVLDPTSLATKNSIGVGDMPAEVTFSKDGLRAFSANGMSNDVTVIDVARESATSTIPVGDDPVGAWQGADDVMYVDAEEGKTVTAIDARTLAVVRTYHLGFTPGMAMTTPSASELWVTNADAGRVAYYATTSTTKLGELAVGAGAHGIVFAPDGKMAWITNQLADTVSVVDVARHVVTATIEVGDRPNGLVYRAM